jgi:uncharacterized protein YuzE
MKITYDESVDAAYLYLTEGSQFRVSSTVAILDPHSINLDFDDDGKLIGIEFLGASSVLPKAVLA